MPIRNDFKPGEFCWVDLSAHDLDAATTWYGNLFGWTSMQQDTGGGPPYSFFLRGEAAAGAVGQMNDEMKAQGIPPMWNSYVCVEDCAATQQRAADLGATITVPTTEIPGYGKLCFILDPEGASVAMWQQTGEAGPGVAVGEPNSLSWNELMCRDVAASREFYGQLFGWKFADMPMGDVVYTMIKCGDQDAGGMMAMDGPQFEGIPSHWLVYFAVADCDAATKAVADSSGVVRVPPTEIPVGKFSVVADPQGATFSLIQLAPKC